MEKIRIKKEDLDALLQHEETTEETLQRYFDFRFDKPFTPSYTLKSNVEVIYSIPDHADGVTERGLQELLIKTANRISRRRRKRRYRQMLEQKPDSIRIVSEGDSWFQHPHPKVKDTIDHLSQQFPVFSVGAAGDELKNMYREQEYYEAIKEVEPQFFLLSGGGNDILGSQFQHYLRKDFRRAPVGYDPKRFLKNAFFLELNSLAMIYRNILESLCEMKPDMHILLHGYDYIIPESRTNTGWLGRYMIEKGIDEHQDRQNLINIIIDSFNYKIAETASAYDQVHFIDVRKRVANDRWYDEIHPDSDGFGVVAQCFSEKMAALIK